MILKAPFPWFGGKSRASHLIWQRFGDVPNYVEPFAGSLAVLLGRPTDPSTETVNDLDCYVANFWRAVSKDAESVAKFCDWPVNEADLLARHRWLLAQADFIDRMKSDSEFSDSKIAGWWVWGICAWIGSGWCRQCGDGNPPEQLPHLGTAGMGIHRKLPHLGDAGRGSSIQLYFRELQNRLRRVRVACGEWHRVLGESVTIKHGITAVLLDPPYDEDEHCIRYSAGGNVSDVVMDWALDNGNNPMLRIALCCYDGESDMPGWECVAWKASGGYGGRGDGQGRINAHRERIWFSPHCLNPLDDLFHGRDSTDGI